MTAVITANALRQTLLVADQSKRERTARQEGQAGRSSRKLFAALWAMASSRSEVDI